MAKRENVMHNRVLVATMILTGFINMVESTLAADRAYWAAGQKVFQTDLPFGSSSVTTPIMSGSSISGVAVDRQSGHIYYTDGTEVRRADLDGSNDQALISGLPGNVHDIELDLCAGKIYWIDGGANLVQCADIEPPRTVTTLFSLPAAGFLELDLRDNAKHIYYSYKDALGVSKVGRSDLDGMNQVDIITTGISGIRDVGLDAAAGKLYWTDQLGEKIECFDLDGNPRDVLIDMSTVANNSGATVPIDYPYAIAIDPERNMFYFSDAGNDNMFGAGIDMPNNETPGTRTDVVVVWGNAGLSAATIEIVPECTAVASWNNYCSGKPGTCRIPGLTCDADPILGKTFNILIENSNCSASVSGFLLVGTTQACVPAGGGFLAVSAPFVLHFLVLLKQV